MISIRYYFLEESMGSHISQQLGNYRLLRLLGTGGFAEVYLGEHIRLGTLAALKVLHTSLSGAEVDSFLREAQTIAKLDHPHIVRVLDYDVQAGTPFLVMNFAPGGTLRKLHPKGTVVPLPAIVDYVTQVAEALHYAHERRVIHRDIKPENLLLGGRHEVLLSDFGIALLAQTSRLQSTQEVVGTAAYMAPEQFRGKPCFASDQYALGVVVYEWLCGEHPFSGSFLELASQHLFATPPSLQEKGVSFPSVERVVFTALAKNPAQRFGNIKDFASALAQASHDTTTSLFSLHSACSNLPHNEGLAPTVAVASSPIPTQRDSLLSPENRSMSTPEGNLPPSAPQHPVRTAIIKRVCLGLVLMSVLLWLLTATNPVLHQVFAGAILLSLILWIAAYADHRRATERRSSQATNTALKRTK